MLHELFITHCNNGTLIVTPFTFIKDSYNHETLMEARNWKKLETQLAKSGTAGIFNLRCPANKVTPKTFHIKWKGNKFEQAIIKNAECSLIHNSIKCTNIKIKHLQTEIPATSLQQKLDEPAFTDLLNIIFNNKGIHSYSTRTPKSRSSSTSSPDPLQQPPRWPPRQPTLSTLLSPPLPPQASRTTG